MGGALIYVSSALTGEFVAVEETDDGLCRLRFYHLAIGVIDTRQRRLRPAILAACGEDRTSAGLSEGGCRLRDS